MAYDGRHRVYVGYDSREADAFRVAVWTLKKRSSVSLDVRPLLLPHLEAVGLYWRKHERRDAQLWDVISNAPCSTEFSLTRFLVPYLGQGWTLFCDADFLFRADVSELFALTDPAYAVMCVKHRHEPAETEKMDGQAQTAYPRKNWSSLMLVNCAHPANKWLTPAVVNATPGRDLHALCWLKDDLIGELPREWNHLVGVDPHDPDAKGVHFTLGTPDMPGYADQPFADEWRAALGEIWR